MAKSLQSMLKGLGSSVLLAAAMLHSGSAHAANWQQVWADEFNGSISGDWGLTNGGGGFGNNEQQYYLPQNATIENNMLVITAKRENYGGASYTSAKLSTQGHKSWSHGKIVARIKLPAFQGSWPAFWMLGDNIGSVGWPSCGELDIMEQINTNNTVWGSTHWLNGGQADFTQSGNTSVTGFHEYSIEWDTQYIKWFIDGSQYNSFFIGGNPGGTGVFNNNKFFLILNLAVGGNWPGFSIDNNALPGKMYVDWVRVYQDGGTVVNPPVTPISATTPQFMIVNKYSGKALDLIGGNTANGARINQWTFDYNGGNQRFAILPTENKNHVKLISAVTGKAACIAGDSLDNGAQLHAWDYVGNNPGQQFDLVDVGNGWFKIRNVKSGKVLDDSAWGTDNDGKIQQWDDANGDNQLWRLQPQGDYFIQANGGRYICVANSGSTDGQRIILWDKGDNAWFKWRFASKGDGWYGCMSLNALSKALCVEGGSVAAGHYCHLWEYNQYNVGDQKIRVVPQTDGTFKFYFAFTGQTWDMPGGQTANTTPLTQYPDNGNVWQRFRLERVP